MTLVEFNKAKIGNLLVFLSEKIPLIERKKLMKLLYFIDETAVKESGVPITWFDYLVCKKGPVPMEMWSDKLSDANRFAEYVDMRKNKNGVSVVIPKTNFNHTEFSKRERRVINEVMVQYGSKDFYELSDITHQSGTPWSVSKGKHSVKDDEDSNFIVDLTIIIPKELQPIHEEASCIMRYKAELAF